MQFLLASLLSSLLVGLFIKYLKITDVRNLFIMFFTNYLVAIIVCYSIFYTQIEFVTYDKSNYFLPLILGILMPSVFYFLNKSLYSSGLARTDIFQRLSLIIPVGLSFWLFHEEFSWNKFVAILLAFSSIYLLLYKKSTKDGNFNTFYLMAVFVGYGTVDTIFKIIATQRNVSYITSLFLVFVFCAIVSSIYLFLFKSKLNYRFILYGVVLGILNFANIYFYMMAHKIFIDSPTLVFITMNLGVIIGGVSIGSIYFKEKISKLALIGIALAVCSVVLLALIQIKYI